MIPFIGDLFAPEPLTSAGGGGRTTHERMDYRNTAMIGTEPKAGRARMRILALLLVCAALAGCGAVALPFRVTADVARVVPVAGDVVAAPLDAAGDAID